MINVNLVDASSGKKAKINGEGELNVVVHPHPPIDEVIAPLPFRQYFTDNGFSDGSNDMIIDGATTPTEFCIAADSEADLYIKTISVQLSDNGASLDDFGALSPLTNGVEFYYQNNEIGQLQIHEGIKDNLTFIRLGVSTQAFGAGTTAYRADISGGSGTDTYFPVIDLNDTFGLQWGLRLKKNTTDKIVFNVQDNLSGLDIFNIIGYGIKI